MVLQYEAFDIRMCICVFNSAFGGGEVSKLAFVLPFSFALLAECMLKLQRLSLSVLRRNSECLQKVLEQ